MPARASEVGEVLRDPGKQFTKAIYDESIGALGSEFTTSDRELSTFSIAAELRNTHGEKATRWIHCADWKELSPLVRKGDRVKVTGRFSERSYEKDGETKIWREFVLETLSIVRHKIRHPAESLPGRLIAGSPPLAGGFLSTARRASSRPRIDAVERPGAPWYREALG